MIRHLLCIAALLLPSLATAAEPQRWALLVGVNDYAGFSDLRYSGRDAVALADALRGAGFDERRVFVVHDDAKDAAYRPSKPNIERHLNAIMTLAGPDDLVIVSFSGHGIHFDGQSFLCPIEADDRRPAESMIAVADVYKRFESCKAALKLLLVDACRNDPRPPGRKSPSPDTDRKALGAAFARPPAGIMVLQSCAEDQVSWEDEQLQHGVFMHHVLKGLAGEADGNKNGRVTLSELYDYASDETKLFVANRFAGEIQIPALNGNIRGVFEFPQALPAKEITNGIRMTPPATPPVVPRNNAPAGNTITNSIGMTFAPIPAGDFLMGFRPGEAGAGDDDGPQRKLLIPKPFHMSIHEVTQDQWRSVMTTTPWIGRSEVKEGADYPATRFSWNDANEFCRKLSNKEGKTYRLPTETEWEYACRASTTTQYSFGDGESQLSDFAWWGGIWGDGNAKAEKYAHAVGQKLPNAWGLHDMHGNVWEWCSDVHYSRYGFDLAPGESPPSFHATRGGSWASPKTHCRSATQSGDQDHGDVQVGMRVILVP